MKTPLATLTLAALALAPFARAAEIAHRCDAAWLESVPKSLADGVQLDQERVEVGAGGKIGLKIGFHKTCAEPAWRHIVTPSPNFNVQGMTLAYNNEEIQAIWGKTVKHQAALLLVADDLFRSVDAKGSEAVTAADPVIAAGVALGLVSKAEGQTVAHDLGETLTGEPFRSQKVIQLTVVENGPATVKGADAVRAELEKIVKDAPGGKRAPGAAVLAFRKAVLALEAEVAAASKSAGRAEKRFAGLDQRPSADFLCASCKLVGGAADDARAADDAAYQAALKALVAEGIKNEGDAQNLPTGALNFFDRGLRNLIAVRAAQVAQIEAAAAKLLGTDSVQAHITGVRLAEKGAAEQLDPKSVGGQMLASLARSKDYQDLSQLYDNKRSQPGWLEGAEGQAVVAAMGGMEKDAKAAQIVGTGADGRFEFTVGGQKRVANNVNVERFAYDAEYQQQILNTVTGYIVEGNTTDAKVQAALGAFRGAGQPGSTLDTNLTADQRELGNQLPKPSGNAAPAATGPVATAKEAGCGSPADIGKNSMERYADKKKRAAAEAAANNASDRDALQRKREARLATVDAECEIERNWIKTGRQKRYDADGIEVAGPREQLPYMNPDLDRNAAIAELERHCAARRQTVVDETLQEARDKGIVGSAKEKEAQAQAEKEADDALEAQYKIDIEQSFKQLRDAYKTAGTKERTAVETATGYTGTFYKVERIEAYFKDNWDADTEKATARCKVNLGFQRGLPPNDNDFKLADQDNVDKYCGVEEIDPRDPKNKKKKPVGVRDGVIAAMKAHRSSVSTVVPPTTGGNGTPVVKPTTPDLDAELNGK